MSRENYKKYGHPDGPQAMSGGLGAEALPPSSSSAAPLMRAAAVAGARPHSHLHHAGFVSRRTAPLRPMLPLRPLLLPIAVSVALPAWLFNKDKKAAPVILMFLLFGCIVTPVGLAVWYLMGTQK